MTDDNTFTLDIIDKAVEQMKKAPVIRPVVVGDDGKEYYFWTAEHGWVDGEKAKEILANTPKDTVDRWLKNSAT